VRTPADASGTTQVHVIAHTHWDREWYLTREQYRARLVDLVDRVLDRMSAEPEFRYFHLDGQTIVIEDYLEVRPEREVELRRRIAEGRLLVGPWAAVRSDAVAGQIDRGPGDSGVYARFEAAGRRLALLDARGRATRRLGPGTGLVAATRLEDEQPTWVVTGTDARGVRDAAHALEERTLAQRFAVATGGGATVRLPEAGE